MSVSSSTSFNSVVGAGNFCPDPSTSKCILSPCGGSPLRIYGDPLDQSVFGALTERLSQWEPHVVATMRALVRPTSVCIDAGANIGIHSLNLSRLAPMGAVYAFEPSTKSAYYLKKNIDANLAFNIHVIAKGLGAETRKSQFCDFEEFGGTSFVASDSEAGKMDRKLVGVFKELRKHSSLVNSLDSLEPKYDIYEIELVSLDEWVDEQELSNLDLIKVDVEGGELDILMGAQKTINRFEPSVISELNPACLESYFQISSEQYMNALLQLFPYVYYIEPLLFELRLCRTVKDIEPTIMKYGWTELLCTFKEAAL